MKTKKQTKINEYNDKEIVEEKYDEKTKTSQIKKLKSINKIINEMLIELEPKPQSKSDESTPDESTPDESTPKDKPNYGLNFGYKHKESKPNFGSKPQEKKFDFGSKNKESKPNFGSKPQEKKFDFGSKSTGIKTIPVTSTKLQPAWKQKQE